VPVSGDDCFSGKAVVLTDTLGAFAKDEREASCSAYIEQLLS
jgi:hypothetical protein